MSQIASPRNPRLKALRRLHGKRERARLGRFLAEGEDLIAAAERAGRAPVEGYRLAGSGVGGAGFRDVEPAALARASTLGSGTRVIAVYEQRWQDPAGPLCVYLHGVADPGNVGTVLRSAQAFGASSVALGPGCADPHSPKAVRASMGAIFSVALARVGDLGELPGERIALVAGAGEPLRGPGDPAAERTRQIRKDHPGAGLADGAPEGAGAPVTLLVGAEREGLPADLVEACERTARIPIASESLNAAMAATVALYEMTRWGGRGIDTVPAS
jgi:TrmH family RNA methyltransferase